jgi:type I restriction enzyme S subunit
MNASDNAMLSRHLPGWSNKWPTVRVADRFQIVNGYPFDSGRFSLLGGTPLIRIRDIHSDSTDILYDGPIVEAALVENGDVIIGMDGDFEVARWRGERALLNQRLCVLRSGDDVLERYLAYFLPERLKLINDLTYSTTVKHLSSFQIASLRMPMPADDVMQEIVEFLDRETATADALAGDFDDIGRLLEEKRVSFITQAVTKGLEPSIPLKGCDIPWIGNVPNNSRLTKIKHLAEKIGSGITPRGGADVYQDSGITFIRSQNVYDDGLRLDDAIYISPEIDSEMARTRVQAGDVLLNITGASIGRTCVVDPAILPANVNQHVCIVRPSCAIEPAYLALSLKSQLIKQQILAIENGSSREGLNYSQVGNLLIVVPADRNEQVRIVQEVQDRLAEIDALIIDTKRARALVAEQRAALITAAVTGQITISSYESPFAERRVA